MQPLYTAITQALDLAFLKNKVRYLQIEMLQD